MKTKVILIMAFALAQSVSLPAQTVEALLKQVEQNNPSLHTARKSADAAKASNHTDNTLDPLEVGYNRLWGKPSLIGNRHDVSVAQPFEIPTIIGTKGKVARNMDVVVEDDYLQSRQSTLLEAKMLYIDVVYYNALLKSLEQRQAQTATLLSMQKHLLEAGEINILDYNNVVLSLSSTETSLTQASAERDAVIAQLINLNGGNPVAVSDTVFVPIVLPSDFDTWFSQAAASAPSVAMARDGVTLSRSRLSLARQSWLPTLSVGYMSEKTLGEQFQGVTVGMSLPLWSAGKKVKEAKAETLAAESAHTASVESLRGVLSSEYALTKGLVKAADKCRSVLVSTDNTSYLMKACQSGELSTLEYLISLGSYYEAKEKALAAERDAQKANARLTSIFL